MSLLLNETSLGNIIITLGSILLLIILVKQFAWEQLTSMFKKREEKISQDIDGAAQARQQAEEMASQRQLELAQARQEAGQIIEGAKETGHLQGKKLVEQAQLEVSRMKEQASQDIAQSKLEALASVKNDMSELTVALTEKILMTKLDDKAKSDLVDQYLNQLGE